MHHKRGSQDSSLVCAQEDAAMGLCSTFAVGRKWIGRGGLQGRGAYRQASEGIWGGPGVSESASLCLPGVTA